MILSTTPTIEGHPIREYRGVVTGETIIGTNFVSKRLRVYTLHNSKKAVTAD